MLTSQDYEMLDAILNLLDSVWPLVNGALVSQGTQSETASSVLCAHCAALLVTSCTPAEQCEGWCNPMSSCLLGSIALHMVLHVSQCEDYDPRYGCDDVSLAMQEVTAIMHAVQHFWGMCSVLHVFHSVRFSATSAPPPPLNLLPYAV